MTLYFVLLFSCLACSEQEMASPTIDPSQTQWVLKENQYVTFVVTELESENNCRVFSVEYCKDLTHLDDIRGYEIFFDASLEESMESPSLMAWHDYQDCCLLKIRICWEAEGVYIYIRARDKAGTFDMIKLM